MNLEPWLYPFVSLAFPLVAVLIYVLPRRWRMERRARALLARHPGAERMSLYVAFHSTWPGQKQREMDVKIAELEPQGWVFLRATEASPWRTLRSWGGGLTLHFIRTPAAATGLAV